MIVRDDIQQGTDEWHELRKKRIGGTRLGDIWSSRAYMKKDLIRVLSERKIEFKKTATTTELEELLPDDARIELLKDAPRKIGFYELVAEHLSTGRDDEEESRMDRGSRLEAEARDWFAETYKKDVVEVGLCISEVDDRIYNSPDGLIKDKKGKFTEALEIKCLSPAHHIQAVVENKVPDDYWSQNLQYFIVNEDLQKLYWLFYDPSIAAVSHHVIEVTRDSLGDWPQRLLEFQVAQLQRIDEIVEQLAF